MAIHRRTSQKPTNDLLNNFKASFPRFDSGFATTTCPSQDSQVVTDSLDVSVNPNAIDIQSQDLKQDAMRQPHDPWNFGMSAITPSLMDPNSQTFSMFANQAPGYYTPTPGGTNTIFHPQAGDLHTPFTMGLSTPHSLPTSAGASLHANQQFAAFPSYSHQMPQHMQQPFQNTDPFGMGQQPQSFPPHHFSHHPNFDHMEGPVGESPIENMGMDLHMQEQHQSPMLYQQQGLHHTAMQHGPLRGSEEKFRYYITLNAPTAMIKHADEIPITYLNKGQAYTLDVLDTQNQQPSASVRYRTFVRVSFEDEQQRQKPAQCWQLWKEGRGTNEAHQRGGRLQAVEYVESGQMAGAEDPSKPRVQLESASFDGFCVTWSPSPGRANCPISVRFNFLSTDFSHSKGVKGIPVRLCAKTEMLQETSAPAQPLDQEVSFCKVKLFRDHGAERKLSNDVAHIRKTIEKIDQQIEQMRNGLRDPGNRKKKGPAVKPPPLDSGIGKAPKHRRTWSLNSVTSVGGRGSAEDDLLTKKATLHDMFHSTHQTSIFHLRGEPEDDPDLFPVKIPGGIASLPRTDSTESAIWEQQSSLTGAQSTAVSPTPSSISLDLTRRDSTFQAPTPQRGPVRTDSEQWRAQPQTATTGLYSPDLQALSNSPESRPSKVQARSANAESTSQTIEALGVDFNYQAPAERPVKPLACFYVQPQVAGARSADGYYRAIYLYQRTLQDFERALATKCDIEPTSVLRTVRVTHDGLSILLDDECIVELPEAQALTADFMEIAAGTPAKSSRTWNAGPSDVQCDGDIATVENVHSHGYELRLFY